MLVLGRRQNESLIITNEQTGEVIRVELLSCDHNRGRIGITASDNYRIDRGENVTDEPLAEMTTGG